MENNKVINDVIYVSEMEAWVDVKEYLQHAMSLANYNSDIKFELKYKTCLGENDSRWFEPYIRVYTKDQADQVLERLTDGDDDIPLPSNDQLQLQINALLVYPFTLCLFFYIIWHTNS